MSSRADANCGVDDFFFVGSVADDDDSRVEVGGAEVR